MIYVQFGYPTGALDKEGRKGELTCPAVLPLTVTESKVTVPPWMYAPPPCERGRNKEMVLTFLSKGTLERFKQQRAPSPVGMR